MGRFFKKFSAQCHKIAVLTASYSEGTICSFAKRFPRQVAKTPFPLPRIVKGLFRAGRKFPRLVAKTPFPLPRIVREDSLSVRVEDRKL